VFFDTFRNSQPFTEFTPAALLSDANRGEVRCFQNDKWKLHNVQGDLQNTKHFVSGNHFMETLYDGGTPGGNNPLHNHNASFVMEAKPTADISGGKVLHVTFEVDAHMSPRRWCDMFVGEANDTLRFPGQFAEGGGLPTAKGNLFRWEIQFDVHRAQVFKNVNGGLQRTEVINAASGEAARIRWDQVPIYNGTQADLDRRHRFDLYLSQNRVRLVEDGHVAADNVFPAGTTLPFSKCTVYFTHEVYHTMNDRGQLMELLPDNPHWLNYRPWADERHWDNMGFEVLNAFPP
jgi:hypothetical protein